MSALRCWRFALASACRLRAPSTPAAPCFCAAACGSASSVRQARATAHTHVQQHQATHALEVAAKEVVDRLAEGAPHTRVPGRQRGQLFGAQQEGAARVRCGGAKRITLRQQLQHGQTSRGALAFVHDGGDHAGRAEADFPARDAGVLRGREAARAQARLAPACRRACASARMAAALANSNRRTELLNEAAVKIKVRHLFARRGAQRGCGGGRRVRLVRVERAKQLKPQAARRGASAACARRQARV